jgi:LysR family transcriptional regulator, glycine cleavage system transcriptional activator
VARHASFSAAAKELNLSQSAVSQQIRSLEDAIGASLFTRLTRRVELTKAGHLLAHATQGALDQVARAVSDIRGQTAHENLCIAVLPSLASRWLARRIPKFCAQYPEVEVSIYPAEDPREIEQHRADIAILYGDGSWKGHLAEEIFREHIFPVCSPHLIKKRRLRNADELLAFRLLREADVKHDLWAAWLSAAGVRRTKVAEGPKFDNLSDVITLALRGEGIALLRSALVSDELESGNLIRLFEINLRAPSSYYLVWPHKPSKGEIVSAFRKWLIEEFQTTSGVLVCARPVELVNAGAIDKNQKP